MRFDEYKLVCGPAMLTRICLFVLIWVFGNAINSRAQTTPPAEYALKAVFLYNFTNFVDWPDSIFADSSSAIVIAVIGDDPFGIYLDETIKNERVNNRPLTVSRYRDMHEIKNCQVLYISQSESERASKIVDDLKGKSVLTVSDQSGFADANVIIKFATENKKIRLKIDVGAAEEVDLTISSKLLRLADIVSSRKD